MKRSRREFLNDLAGVGAAAALSGCAGRVVPGETYETLEKRKYDQVPCGSTYSCDENFGKTVAHCRARIGAGRLKGFLMAPWYYRTQEDKREKILKSIDIVGEIIKRVR